MAGSHLLQLQARVCLQRSAVLVDVLLVDSCMQQQTHILHTRHHKAPGRAQWGGGACLPQTSRGTSSSTMQHPVNLTQTTPHNLNGQQTATMPARQAGRRDLVLPSMRSKHNACHGNTAVHSSA